MIDKNKVSYIAHLSRISLTEKEVERLTKTLEDILHYIEKLNTLNVDKVAPTSHVLPLKNVYREDTAKPSLPLNEVMDMAARTHNGSFKVPRIIE